jgi:hypothetical protein
LANEAKSVAKANWDCSDGLLIRGYVLSARNIAEIMPRGAYRGKSEVSAKWNEKTMSKVVKRMGDRRDR